ncbi:hypothetical protein SDRG_03063 [Saprolegnia diclina VS20]|uniref:Uncharacterized protein n=1 Tax=Saprolegnia diclina (strain VS20) TaxID=1156394 RepID=T0SA17_SAPDV|nr:hypothetical protein SDRG_03063 [Saprolegnia diclina VS20]EQC39632.1 hypothetical protein SDRG_03063 [Saprolegnia diclina VS20]|eukprot:XP_008606904.1 hypothetical protein SDRG_03063 [Saprolegnia diclina VS20]
MATVSAMAATAKQELRSMMESDEADDIGSDAATTSNASAPLSPLPAPTRRARTRSSSLSAKSGGEDNDEYDAQSEMGTPSKARPHAVSTAETNGLRRNVKVVVQRTADVEQRLPQMVDKIGTIVETPRHPNTWFRVRFENSKVLTFRASGLRPLRDAQADGLHLDQQLADDDDDHMHADDDADADDEMHDAKSSFAKGSRVTLKLDDAAKRNKELKPLNGSACTILEVLPSGYKVQPTNDPSVTRIVKRKLLRLLEDDATATDDDAKKSATTNDEADSDGDNDDDNDYDPASAKSAAADARRKPKKKDQGTFLSDIDTEMWIGRRVRINVGKYSGQPAIVLKSGNGWVQLQVDDPMAPKTAKRAYELTLLESVDAIALLPPSSKPDSSEIDETGTNAGDSDVAAADDSNIDSQDDERKGGALSRRRGHYGVSWIERKVLLPANGGSGIVKKADRETCTVEVDNISKTLKVFRKSDLVLMEEDVVQRSRRTTTNHGNNRNAKGLHLPEGAVLMGITSTRYAMFQDQVKKHVMRRRDKIKHRPNLRDWQAALDMQYTQVTELHDELSPTIDLFLVASCTLCGVEKDLDGSCWNEACPRSSVWNPLAPTTLVYSRLPKVPLMDPRTNRTLQPDAADHVSVLRVEPEPPLPVVVDDVSVLKRKRVDDADVAAPTTQEKSVVEPPKKQPVVVIREQIKKPVVASPLKALPPSTHVMSNAMSNSPKPAIVPTTTALPTASFRPQYESVFGKKG